jgi:hypothetical protein
VGVSAIAGVPAIANRPAIVGDLYVAVVPGVVVVLKNQAFCTMKLSD